MSAADVAILAKAVGVLGQGVWMTLIVLQNLTDRSTNIFLIGNVITMRAIKEDPNMGNGLEWRAVSDVQQRRIAGSALNLLVALQVATASALVVGGAMVALSIGADGGAQESAIAVAAIGVLLLIVHWTVLLCGGLWFGYWMKMAPVQQVHMTMLAIAFLLLLVLFALPPSIAGA